MWKYVADYSLFTDELFIVFKDSTAPSHGQCLRERESATSSYSTAELLKSSLNSASVCRTVTLSISRCASGELWFSHLINVHPNRLGSHV
jgi:hypothetical protein